VKIGFGQVNITPPIPTVMAGSVARRVAKKVHDELFAKAMVVVDDEGTKVAIVGCDVLALKRQTVAKAREIIQNKCGIDNGVLIAATHTHAGPLTTRIFNQTPDEVYLEILAHKIAEAVYIANQNLAEGEIGIGTGREERATFNKRFIMADGKVETQPTPGNERIVRPEGPKDSQVGVIYAERQGIPLGAIVNYSCHPVCVGWNPEEDHAISADYPGYIARTIKEKKGEGFVTVFLNGACGNLNPCDHAKPSFQESYRLAEERGKMIGAEALRIMEKMDLSSQHSVCAISKVISLPLRDISDEELMEAKRIAEKIKITEDLQKDQFTPTFIDNLKVTLTSIRGNKIYAREILELDEERKRNPYINAEVQAIRIGNGAIVGIPAEIFTEFGLQIKKSSPFPYTFIAELANGCVGYVPTKDAFGTGPLSYETRTAKSSKLAPEAGEMFVKTAIELLQRLAN